MVLLETVQVNVENYFDHFVIPFKITTLGVNTLTDESHEFSFVHHFKFDLTIYIPSHSFSGFAIKPGDQ